MGGESTPRALAGHGCSAGYFAGGLALAGRRHRQHLFGVLVGVHVVEELHDLVVGVEQHALALEPAEQRHALDVEGLGDRAVLVGQQVERQLVLLDEGLGLVPDPAWRRRG
jgi:hypothetical protein